MAIKLEGSIRRWVGQSTDVKPKPGVQADGSTVADTDLPAGSSFLETDTGRIYRWDGAFSWQLALPNPDEQLYVLEAILIELSQLRQLYEAQIE